jgi:hypothetical protein
MSSDSRCSFLNNGAHVRNKIDFCKTLLVLMFHFATITKFSTCRIRNDGFPLLMWTKVPSSDERTIMRIHTRSECQYHQHYCLVPIELRFWYPCLHMTWPYPSREANRLLKGPGVSEKGAPMLLTSFLNRTRISYRFSRLLLCLRNQKASWPI